MSKKNNINIENINTILQMEDEDNNLLSSPKRKNIRLTLDNKLIDARKEFIKNKRLNSQLGLSTNVSMTGTPENEEIITNERKEELGFRRQTFWKSCGGCIVDRRIMQFFVQVFIGLIVIIFCMIKIFLIGPTYSCSGEDPSVYFSLLSTIIGFFIPSPSLGHG